MRTTRKGIGAFTLIAVSLLLFQGSGFIIGMMSTGEVLREEVTFASGDAHLIAETEVRKENYRDNLEINFIMSANTMAMELGEAGGGVGNAAEYSIAEHDRFGAAETWVEMVPSEEELEEAYFSAVAEEIQIQDNTYACSEPEIGQIEKQNRTNYTVWWEDPTIECESRERDGETTARSQMILDEQRFNRPNNYLKAAYNATEISDIAISNLESRSINNAGDIDSAVLDAIDDFQGDDFPEHFSPEDPGVELTVNGIYEEDYDGDDLLAAEITIEDWRQTYATRDRETDRLVFDWVIVVLE